MSSLHQIVPRHHLIISAHLIEQSAVVEIDTYAPPFLFD